MSHPQRRIEDRIRELCAKAVVATDGDLEPVLQELLQLLGGTIDHMRKSATSLLVEGKPLLEPRRRENDNKAWDATPLFAAAANREWHLFWNVDGESYRNRRGENRLLYADFVVGGRNSRTFPRSCRGSHFAGFENLIGM